MALHVVDSVGTDMFLIEIEREKSLYAHAVGTLSDVVDRIANDAHFAEDGEEPDSIEVWHLSYGCPMMVTVEAKRHDPIGFVELIFTWNQGNPHTGKITSRHESGYYKIPGA